VPKPYFKKNYYFTHFVNSRIFDVMLLLTTSYAVVVNIYSDTNLVTSNLYILMIYQVCYSPKK